MSDTLLPLSISQEVLRSVLYGKWCNVFGGQKELTFKSNILENVEYHDAEEGNVELDFDGLSFVIARAFECVEGDFSVPSHYLITSL